MKTVRKWNWKCFWIGHDPGNCQRCGKPMAGTWESRFWYGVTILGVLAFAGLVVFGLGLVLRAILG